MESGEAAPAGSVGVRENVDAEARGALDAYVAELDAFFARDPAGVYLYGSVAYDDAFVPTVSDLDVAVLLRRDLDDARRDELEELHAGLNDLAGLGRLDVTFVPLRLVGRRGDASLPYLRDGRFQRTGGGDANLVMWRALRDRGVVIRGDPPALFVPRVGREELEVEMRQNLLFLRRRMPAYVASGTRDTVFGVLSLCRVLYTLRTGELIGKIAGARWALDNVESQWHSLARQAVRRYEKNGLSDMFRTRALAFAYHVSESAGS